MYRKALIVATLFFCAWAAVAAQSSPNQFVAADEVFDRVLARNVLTSGGAPFHAVLQIAEEHGDAAYAGSVEVFWAEAQRYRVHVNSRDFEQTLIVNGGAVQEEDRGDFYPGWLQSFVTALLNPIPRLDSLRGRGGRVSVGPTASFSCVKRDDRPGGITDQMTWASVCFSGPKPDLQFVSDFTYNMEFADTEAFEGKFVPSSYVSGEGDHARLHGKLKTLEAWKPVDDLVAVTTPTPPERRILTTLVSTQQEESQLEHAPENVVWPAVREGRTEGFMIVQALTDRTGQVRETSKHNSDNALLESFGRELALKYKFRPLLVKGVPQQMETPLVLHFSAAQGKPLPELSDPETRKRVTGCDLPREIRDPASAGKQLTIRFYIVESGRLSQLGISDRSLSFPALYGQFRSCHFGVLQDSGQDVPYYASLLVTAR